MSECNDPMCIICKSYHLPLDGGKFEKLKVEERKDEKPKKGNRAFRRNMKFLPKKIKKI